MICRTSTAGIAFEGGPNRGFPAGRFLVALRKPGTTIGESWEFPGGKTGFFEMPRTALRREFAEEFRVPINVSDQILLAGFSNGAKRYILRAYLIELLSDRLELLEHQELRWVTVEECTGLPMAPSDRMILHRIRRLRDEQAGGGPSQ